jgi:hypothetical protein
MIGHFIICDGIPHPEFIFDELFSSFLYSLRSEITVGDLVQTLYLVQNHQYLFPIEGSSFLGQTALSVTLVQQYIDVPPCKYEPLKSLKKFS